MKKIYLLSLILLLGLQSCLPGQSDSSKSSSDNDNTDDVVDNSGTGGNTDAGSEQTNTNTCTGTTADGAGTGNPLHHFELFLSGHEAWLPGMTIDF